MRDRVERAGDRHAERQRQCQLGVVDDGARQHARIAAGLLDLGFGEAVDRRHLAPGVGGRDREDRQPGVERDRLAQARRRTAADRHSAVGADAARLVTRLARRLDRHMHHGLREDARGTRAQHRCDTLGRIDLFRRRQDQCALRAEAVDLAFEILQAAGAEDDTRNAQLQVEWVHRHHSIDSSALASKARRQRFGFGRIGFSSARTTVESGRRC